MSEYLSDDEVKQLGLDESDDYLSDDEVATLGLDQPRTSEAASAVAGAAEGFGLGFADELVGARNAITANVGRALGDSTLGQMAAFALPQVVSTGGFGAGLKAMEAARSGEGPSIDAAVRDYVLARNETRAMQDKARADNPNYFLGGEVAGAVLNPIPFGKAKTASTLSKLARGARAGAATGAAYGLGSSSADLTEGEVGGAALDTALGGTLGAAGGVAGEAIGLGVGKLTQKLRGRASEGVAKAISDEESVQRALQEKAEASALGKYRSSVQSASRDLEVLQREAAALPDSSPLKKQIQDYIASSEGLAVREQVAANKMGTAPERISEMAEGRAVYDDLVAGREQNVAAGMEEALANPVQKHVKPRLATLGHRMIPVGLAAAGGIIGGPEGAAAGGVVGGVVSLIQGRPGVIIKNLMQKPAVRKWFWQKVLAGAGGAAEQAKLIPVLENAAAQGDKRFAAVSYILSQKSEAGRDLMKRVADALKDSGEEGELAQR